MLGGRTNHWGRISLRFGPDDFKKKSIDGLGDDWPIGYDDIKPYYDKVDKLIGVFGTKENIYNEPDGFFLPPPKPRLHELFYINAARKSNVRVMPSRLSILTKRLNNDRGVCFYCNGCARSCNVYADFSSGSCLIFPAQKSGGQIDLYVNSMDHYYLQPFTYWGQIKRQVQQQLTGVTVMGRRSCCNNYCGVPLLRFARQQKA